jgi:phospholipid transport system transporter-binding protein
MSVACAASGAAPLADDAASGFLPVDGNARWQLQGAVTTDTAAAILQTASALPLPSTGVVECDGIRLVDSTAVALLLALKRRARSEQRTVAFVNVPAPLIALAGVYGVAELLVG